jgi:hypothetical protein
MRLNGCHDLQESQNSSVNHQIQAAWQIHQKPDRWETFPLSYVQSWDYVRLTDLFDMDCTNQILCIGHTSALQRNKRSLILFNHDELLDVSYTQKNWTIWTKPNRVIQGNPMLSSFIVGQLSICLVDTPHLRLSIAMERYDRPNGGQSGTSLYIF